MEEMPSKIVIIIAGILMACLVIGFGYNMFNKTAAAGDIADEQISKLTNAMVNDKYTTYDGDLVKGSEVLSFISTCSQDVICITVVNANGTTTEYVKTADLSKNADGQLAKAKNKNNFSTVYIDPSSDYEGKVIYTNNTITGVTFTEAR